jgi:hypothetical protein
MTKKSHRVLFSLLAMTAGIIIILLLVFLGSYSKGPISNLLDKAGKAVTKVEDRIIIEQRTDTRRSRIKWFEPYLSNAEMLQHPRPILLGVYDNKSVDNFNSTFDLENALGVTFPLIHIYTAWGSKAEEAFPHDRIQAIYELGSVPVITWEPWLSDFDGEKIPGLRKPEERDKGGMADIAKGKYDTYIREWATEAKGMKNVMFIRVGHEMNDPYRYPWGPQNNKAKDFVAAWRHIHRIFTTVGATNLLWIWSPHPSYGWFDAFYPGDSYVDWVGLNILNYGSVASWSKWWTFDEIFGTHYKELSKFGKPIMITEFGCLAVGGDRNKWFADALGDLPVKYPTVKSVLFFHFSADRTTTEQTLDWTIRHDSMALVTIRKEFRTWADSLKGK